MESMLKDMESYQKFGEKKLKDVKNLMTRLRKKVDSLLATLGVFKGLIESVKTREEALDSVVSAEDIDQIFSRVTNDNEDNDTVSSVLRGITQLSKAILKTVRQERGDLKTLVTPALNMVEKVITMARKINLSKMEDAMEKDVELIVK